MEHSIARETVIAALEKNFYDYVKYTFARNENTQVLDFGNLLLITIGWIGRAQLSENQEAVNKVIEEVKRYFRSAALPAFSWWISPATTPNNLSLLLDQHGFQMRRQDTGMVLQLSRHSISPLLFHKEFTVAAVNSADFLYDYVQVYAQYWKLLNLDIQRAYLKARDSILANNCPVRLYVGYFKGEPVTTCELFFRHGIVGIYAVTTSKKMRNQGFATQFLSMLLTEAAAQGGEFAILLSTPLAKNLYRCLGFEEVCTVTEYRYTFE